MEKVYYGEDEEAEEKKEKLGSGSFGSVYHVVSKDDGSHLAIKQISKQVEKKDEKLQEQIRQDFINEIHILELLQENCEEYILCFTDASEDFQNYYITSEYLGDYVDLENYIANNGEEKIITQHIICNLVTGLNQIHLHKIAHRDIAPKNILVEPTTGKIKYIDFGLSCSTSEQCHADYKIGTPAFMAPEIYYIKPRNYLGLYDYQKADLWALGVTILDLIEGRHWNYKALNTPGPKDSPINQILNENNYRYLEKFAPEILTLLQNLLRKDPSERYISLTCIKHTNTHKIII
jgi:serine/threonine protein kinase